MPQSVGPIVLHAARGLPGDQQVTTFVDQIGYILSVQGTTGEARQSLTTILNEILLQEFSPEIFPVNFMLQAKDLFMLAIASVAFSSQNDLDLATQALEHCRLAGGGKSMLAILHRFPVGLRMLTEVAAVLESQRTEGKVHTTLEVYTRQLEAHHTTPVSVEELQLINGWYHELSADLQERLATCDDSRFDPFHTALNAVYENLTSELACKWPDFFTFEGEGCRDARSGVFSVFISILAVSAPVQFRRAPFVLPWLSVGFRLYLGSGVPVGSCGQQRHFHYGTPSCTSLGERVR